MKTTIIAIALLMSTGAYAQQNNFIGAKKIPGDLYVSSGCGSSWAICRYRAMSPQARQKLQPQLAARCNRATAWMNACK